MYEPKYAAPVNRSQRDVVRFGIRYALPAAAVGFGLERAITLWYHGQGTAVALAGGLVWTIVGTVLFLALRPLGLRTQHEVALTPELVRRVSARRPLLFGALAGTFLLVAGLAYAGLL
ncbi:MAG TPA: hypothetical protein VF665_19305 [Longimicrobium sp.]|jgi:hypothetical protein|uniref:hypothetical protein n=1 Tax=Longimicrobium sp. TaxID=2029185 RepID=UPI002EDB47F9